MRNFFVAASLLLTTSCWGMPPQEPVSLCLPDNMTAYPAPPTDRLEVFTVACGIVAGETSQATNDSFMDWALATQANAELADVAIGSYDPEAYGLFTTLRQQPVDAPVDDLNQQWRGLIERSAQDTERIGTEGLGR